MGFLLALFATLLLGAPADRYASVAVNADGSVTITTEDERQITLEGLPPYRGFLKYVGAEKAAVAPDHQSVGWLALFENGGTSYPVPLKLVIFRNGRVHVLDGHPYLAVWFWSFQDAGKRVAAREDRTHGDALNYDLWDVATGKRLADYTPTVRYENGEEIPRPNDPRWVKTLNAAEAKSR